ncbi:Integrase catalytic domain-containing protein [Citrus sinensis]|uniref:Integrase catalytic domain-containing protein n=1 Tax=Citrus sinensis TaxID=2711 RepID=A0ACB8HVS3_CITSI|nr:Integrase catalytic domain-containing protein [Citrus sinensis]
MDEDDSSVKEKSETIPVYVENNSEDSDSSEAAPEHEEQESVESEAPEVRRSTRERRPPTWHSEYVTEINVAYCLLTEDGEPSTFHEALNSSDKEGIDFNEIFSPVVRLTTIRIVLAMCATFDLHLEQLDVKTAFLHGELEEEIYMLQLEGFAETVKENLVCRLSSDHCAYYKRFEDNDFIILLLYVDDMLVAGSNKDRVQELKAQLAREFEMKDLGPANKILGMQIHRDRNNMKIWLSQKNYLKKILRRFNMQDCKSISISFPVNFKLSSSMCPSNEAKMKEMSQVPYASAVGSLMFAMICTRPDIAQAVGETVVALSTTEAEYMAATQAYKEAIWIQMLLEELRHKQEKNFVYCDSQSALHIARNPAFHSRTKHIGVQYHFVREVVEDESVDLQKIHTKENLADDLTKPINANKFVWSRSSCGLAET